jgi:hypothetical protein
LQKIAMEARVADDLSPNPFEHSKEAIFVAGD